MRQKYSIGMFVVVGLVTCLPTRVGSASELDDHQRAEAIRSQFEPFLIPPASFRDDMGTYRSPLKFADGRTVSSADEWRKRRQEILDQWLTDLGGWPPLLEMPEIKVLNTERRENFTQQRVRVPAYPGDKFADGYLLIPDGDGPLPAVLVTFYEPATSVGLGEKGKGTHDYGLQLVRRGMVTLSIGTPDSFDESHRSTAPALTKAGEAQDRQPLSLLAYAAANAHTALAALPQVDPRRIGIIGLSYGGKWSMFASCLDERFACAVWSDPGIVFNEKNGNVNYWEPWYLGYEKGTRRPAGIPNADRPRTGLYKRLIESGRDLTDLHALMCPRPVLVSGGTEDPPENWRAVNHMRAVNRLLGQKNRVAMTARKSHIPTPEALELEISFLEYYLKYHRKP